MGEDSVSIGQGAEGQKAESLCPPQLPSHWCPLDNSRGRSSCTLCGRCSQSHTVCFLPFCLHQLQATFLGGLNSSLTLALGPLLGHSDGDRGGQNTISPGNDSGVECCLNTRLSSHGITCRQPFVIPAEDYCLRTKAWGHGGSLSER